MHIRTRRKRKEDRERERRIRTPVGAHAQYFSPIAYTFIRFSCPIFSIHIRYFTACMHIVWSRFFHSVCWCACSCSCSCEFVYVCELQQLHHNVSFTPYHDVHWLECSSIFLVCFRSLLFISLSSSRSFFWFIWHVVVLFNASHNISGVLLWRVPICEKESAWINWRDFKDDRTVKTAYAYVRWCQCVCVCVHVFMCSCVVLF